MNSVTKSRLDVLCEALGKALADSQNPLENAKHCLENWLREGVEVPRGATQPKPNAMVQYLLAHPEGQAFTVVSMVMWPHYATPIHNHGTWGLVGVVDGEEREERFDVSVDVRTGVASVRLRSAVVNRASDVTVLTSPHDEIHRITNLHDTPSLSIHVYGGTIDGMPRLAYVDGKAPEGFVTKLERLENLS